MPAYALHESETAFEAFNRAKRDNPAPAARSGENFVCFGNVFPFERRVVVDFDFLVGNNGQLLRKKADVRGSERREKPQQNNQQSGRDLRIKNVFPKTTSAARTIRLKASNSFSLRRS